MREEVSWKWLFIGFASLFGIMYLGFILLDTPTCLFCGKDTSDRKEALWVAVDVQFPGREPIHALKPVCKDCYKAIRGSVFEDNVEKEKSQ